MYPDPEVVAFISRTFVPVRAHVREQAEEYKKLAKRFDAPWTPTTLIVDSEDGTEKHRIEGFLPKEDYLAQLRLGLGHAAFARGRFADARERFAEVLDRHPESDAAPEAQYWTGVARYKETGDNAALLETGRSFTERFAGTVWAKKASVWLR